MSCWVFIFSGLVKAGGHGTGGSPTHFPRTLQSYNDRDMEGTLAVLLNRIQVEPFNAIATVIFFLAIMHTFLISRFIGLSHKWELKHEAQIEAGLLNKYSVSYKAQLFHFWGEIEAVFGLWVVVLVTAIIMFFDWDTASDYINHGVDFTEAMFVVVIMTLAATRPILKLAELIMRRIPDLFGWSLVAWWFTILTVGPIMGSFITEPAAMTISALLLSTKFYDLEPGNKLKYATIGLLFVNVSVGGTFSHFAAPPVLMVTEPWHWEMGHMLAAFGWKSGLGIFISNAVYYLIFRKEFAELQNKFSLVSLKDRIQRKYLRQQDIELEFDKLGCIMGDRAGFSQEFRDKAEQIRGTFREIIIERNREKLSGDGIDINLAIEAFDQRFEEMLRRKMRMTMPGLMPEHERPDIRDPEWDYRDDDVPWWVTSVHVLFLIWTIYSAHHPALFIPGLLFFLGFAQVSVPYQNRINLKPPLLVGFFLGGLVIHGGLQGWWIAPLLGGLGEIPLLFSATVLTAFNDNAAITFLCTLVPDFTEGLKHAVVAGAVAGGGLTIIANAPNPAEQSILKKHFKGGVSPVNLLAGAAVPTVILLACYLVFL